MPYQQPPAVSAAAAAAALDSGVEADAALAVIGAALSEVDDVALLSLLARGAQSASATVRGNAILGLGHFARRFGHLDRAAAESILRAALRDPAEYVRGQALSAIDDVGMFAGWTVSHSRIDS